MRRVHDIQQMFTEVLFRGDRRLRDGRMGDIRFGRVRSCLDLGVPCLQAPDGVSGQAKLRRPSNTPS